MRSGRQRSTRRARRRTSTRRRAWTWAGSGSGTLEALPNTALFTSTQTSPISAYAVTFDGAYLASQARPSNATGGHNWVRVTRSLLPDIAANLNLSNAPGTPAFAALAIADSGGVIYGLNQSFPGGVDTRVAVRYEPGVGVNFPDLTPTGKTWGFPIPRGTSADGLMMVGAAANGQVAPIPPSGALLATNAVAFRYVHTAGTLTGTTTLIPTLPGGTWNMPVALSTTGDRTLVIGNSASYPSGEVYLTDSANNITATLGSPNIGLMPRALGGMTADGTVVAVTLLHRSPAKTRSTASESRSTTNTPTSTTVTGGSILRVCSRRRAKTSRPWAGTRRIWRSPASAPSRAWTWCLGRPAAHRRPERQHRRCGGRVCRRTAGGGVGRLQPCANAARGSVNRGRVGPWRRPDQPDSRGHVPGQRLICLHQQPRLRARPLQLGGQRRWRRVHADNALRHQRRLRAVVALRARPGLAIGVAGDTYTVSDSNCATCSFRRARGSWAAGSIVGGWVGGDPAETDNTFAIVLLGSNLGSSYTSPRLISQPAPTTRLTSAPTRGTRSQRC